jgi:ornithine cyclodeaminase
MLTLTYLNGPDVAALDLTDDEILGAVEAGLRAQGEGRTVIEPRVHLVPGGDAQGTAIDGHFNVLRGYVAPLGLAGVKVVGDFVDNWRRGLPSEMGLLNLFDPATGAPVAVIDAAGLTDMRTGAVTAIGARHLARRDSRVLAHISARGTAYWNVRLLGAERTRWQALAREANIHVD